MNFNYLSVSGIDKFTFYRMPKILFIDDYFSTISCEAKVLYGLLLDRATLSKSNNWIDELGRVYVFFKQTEAMEMLNIKKNKVIAIFKELEDIGLLIRKKQGQGKPTRLYVLDFSSHTDEENSKTNEVVSDDEEQTSDENIKKEVKRLEKQTSEFQTSSNGTKKEVKRLEKQTSKGLKNKPLSSNYINKTEMNKTESIYLSSNANQPTSKNNENINDRLIDRYNNAVNKVKKQIEYGYLIENYEKSTIDLIVSLIADVYVDDSSISVNGRTIVAEQVRTEYAKLTQEHIEFVLESIANTKTKIKNIRTYLQSCLYNAYHTMNIAIDNEINSSN
jgi:hypothetical protein|nr:replication initiator protein A [Ruminococcus sp. 1001270H_150608_F2]